MSVSVSEDKKGRYHLPGLEWITPAFSSWVVTNPSSSSTILGKRLIVVVVVELVATNEVKVVRRGVNQAETFLRDGRGIEG